MILSYFVSVLHESQAENSCRLIWVRLQQPQELNCYTHSCLYMRYFRVPKHCYGCQGLGFLTYAQMLMHEIVHWGSTDLVRESVRKNYSGRRKNPMSHRGLEPASALRLTFQSHAQNSELYYTRIKIFGSCLFLQSVPAYLHASRLHRKQ